MDFPKAAAYLIFRRVSFGSEYGIINDIQWKKNPKLNAPKT